MKIKLIATALTIVIITALIGGFTMAWFTDKDSTELAQFTAGTLKIEAGRINPPPGTLDDRWETVNIMPAEVVSSRQGTTPSGDPINLLRSDPYTVLVLDEGKNDKGFFSLGFDMDEDGNWLGRGGEIIVRFEDKISSYKSSIVLVVEDTWNDNWPLELADVYVSKDENGPWVYVGEARNDRGRPPQYYSNISVSVDEDEIDWFQYVKVIDKSDPRDPKAENMWDTHDGFDLNAIMVQQSEVVRWNPGDTDKIGYYVHNVGNKRAYVRGVITGRWEQKNEDGEWVPFVGEVEDVVEIELLSNNWYVKRVDGTDYYVYKNAIEPGEAVELYLNIHLKGEETKNEYQGKRYVLDASFDAIQVTNGAAESEWGFNPENHGAN